MKPKSCSVVQLESMAHYTRVDGPLVAQLCFLVADFGQMAVVIILGATLPSPCFSPWTRCFVEVFMLEQEQ